MMKKLISLLLCVVMVLSLAACGAKEEEAPAPKAEAPAAEAPAAEAPAEEAGPAIPDGKVTIRIGTSAADTSAITAGANYFGELMSERTGGLVTVKVYPSDSISGGAQAKGIEMLMDGSADMTFHSNLIYSTLDQRLNVISLPWMFDGYEDVDATLAGPAGDAIAEILAGYGIKVLGFAQNGFRQITNNVRPIKTVADLDAVQIRVNNSQMQINLFKAMGADPLNMNFPEVFTAIQQGSIDGQETPIDVTYSSNIHEVSKYLSVWNYMYDSFILGINEATFNSYSPELQEILVEAAAEACEYQRNLIRTNEEAQLADIEASGTEVVYYEDMDIAAFKEASSVIYDEYEPIVTSELLALFRD